MIRSMLVLFAVLSFSATFSGCRSGTGGAPASYYTQNGEYCGDRPYAGCTFTEYGGKIRYWDDPYWHLITFDAYYGYCDTWGDCSDTWYSPSGIWYDGSGFAINARSDRGRDMVGDIAEQEKESLARTAEIFASKYGLAEDRAAELINDVHSFERLTRGRGRTEQDLEQVSQRLLGKSFREAAEAFGALETGNAAPMRALERDVAEFWGTDPETVREVLGDWYRSN